MIEGIVITLPFLSEIFADFQELLLAWSPLIAICLIWSISNSDLRKIGWIIWIMSVFLLLTMEKAFAQSDCERAGNNPVLCNDGEVTTGIDPMAVDAAVLASNE